MRTERYEDLYNSSFTRFRMRPNCCWLPAVFFLLVSILQSAISQTAIAASIDRGRIERLTDIARRINSADLEIAGSIKYLASKNSAASLLSACYQGLRNAVSEVNSRIDTIYYTAIITSLMEDPGDSERSQKVLNINIDMLKQIIPITISQEIPILRHSCTQPEIISKLDLVSQLWSSAEATIYPMARGN